MKNKAPKLKLTQKIFSLINDDDYKIIVIFGIKIKIPLSFINSLYIKKAKKKYGIIANKIVFTNYMGNNYGCNPKYICEEIIKRKLPVDIVWLVKDEIEKSNFPSNVRIIPWRSKKALMELSTAKIWVDNYHKVFHIRRGLSKEKGQIFIQTWHGSFGIKKLEKNVIGLISDKKWLKHAQESSQMTDIWVSNSDFETQVYKQAFWDVKEIKNWGHPKNDIFFKDNKQIKTKVCRYFNLNEDVKILLYVPSFREDETLDFYNIDFKILKEALTEKFGGNWVFLVRLHTRNRYEADELIKESEYIKNATHYPDIQELLVSADSAISDYSSCIFDFMLSQKPAFIYAPDIEKYNNERGFYYPLEKTPFPIACNNIELKCNILNFDVIKYKNNIEDFLKEKVSYEDGNASKRVADYIEEELKRVGVR